MHILAAPAKAAHDGGPWLAHHAPSLIIGALIVLALSALLVSFTGWAKLVVGADGRLSTSRTVTAAWTAVVAWSITTVLLTVLARAGVAHYDLAKEFGNKLHPLSDTYLLLLGGPFAALVLAKGITVSRINNGSLTKTTNTGGISPADLVSNDSGEAELADFQFCLFNLIALVFVVVAFAWHPAAGLPAIPTALAGLTSASALAYTANKAVASNSPVINQVHVRPHPGGKTGGTLTVRGSNLGNAAVTTMTWDTKALDVTAGRAGVFTAELDAAQTKAGPHTLEVDISDGTQTLSAVRNLTLPLP